jgi:hypothetical protein
MVQDSLQVHALSNALRPLFQSGRIWKALIKPSSFVCVKFSSNFLLSYEIFLSFFHNDVECDSRMFGLTSYPALFLNPGSMLSHISSQEL